MSSSCSGSLFTELNKTVWIQDNLQSTERIYLMNDNVEQLITAGGHGYLTLNRF